MNEDKLRKLAERYNIEYSIIGDTCFLHSYGDNHWYFSINEVSKKKIELFHENKFTNKGYHRQNTYERIEKLMYDISKHEKFKFKPHKNKGRMEKLYDQIRAEDEVRNKNTMKGSHQCGSGNIS